MEPPDSIPDLKLRTLESYVERLAAIEIDAESDELPLLVHRISIARMEALRQVELAREAAEQRKSGRDDLWRPV